MGLALQQINQEFEGVSSLSDLTYGLEEVPPGCRYLTLREVQGMDGCSHNWHYVEMREGRFPSPVKITQKAVRWPQVWIDKNLRARALGLR